MNNEYYYIINNKVEKLLDELTIEDGYHLGTTYADSIQGVWTPLNEAQVDFHLANPTASTREVFSMELDVIPEPTPIPESELLDRARQQKIQAIEEQDRSDVVNSFLVNGVSAWLTPEVRANYKNSIESAELLGETEIIFIIAGIPAKSALHEAKVMLAKIQRYADKCTIRTEMHKANVLALTTVEAVETYDHTAGYPVKEEFTLTPMIQICAEEEKQNKEKEGMI